VIHCIHPALIGGAGLLMAKSLDIPAVASFHLDVARLVHHFNLGFMEPIADFLTKTIFSQADYTLAPSRQVQRNLMKLGLQDVGIWQRGVDAEQFNPGYRSDEMRARLSDGHPEDVVLLYVGRLSSEKQIDQLRSVLEAIPNARLALVGDGPAREDLQRHFAGTNTVFMGYPSADIFVFPSALETFGLVVVEAMAAGLPVVASRVGGIPEVVEQGRTGYTFNVGDTPALIDGVRQIARSRETITEMGLAARAFAETQTWPAMNDEVIDLYTRLIESRRVRVA
jgi:glycosyltransferase involved in cell wall biosynthesis